MPKVFNDQSLDSSCTGMGSGRGRARACVSREEEKKQRRMERFGMSGASGTRLVCLMVVQPRAKGKCFSGFPQRVKVKVTGF
jgi:hypothetical protein